MFCPQCGAQAASQTKFCKACGLKLAEFEALLEDPEQASQAKHHLRDGTGFLLVSLFLTLLDFLLYGIVMFRQPNNPALEPLWGTFVLLALPLLCGLGGLAFLWRGGFFKNFHAQQLAAEIEMLEQELEQKRRQLEARRVRQLTAPASNVKAVSITEHTTRELQPQPSNSGKIV